MDCVTAAPFVSMLYDREEVPEDAQEHIVHCVECQTRLKQYARLTAEIRLMTATKQDLRRALELPQSSKSSSFFSGLGSSIRIPRIAVALMVVALAVVSFGWIHTAAQAGLSPMFRAEIKHPELGTTQVLAKPHEQSTFVQFAQMSNGEYKTLAVTLEPVEIRDETVNLRLKAKLFNRKLTVDDARTELESVPFNELAYTPGQPATVELADGDHLTVSGSIVHDSETRSRAPSLAALLPEPDELAITSPVLIADQQQLIGGAPGAAARIHCTQPACGVWLYVPKHGLFIFSKQKWQDAIRGTAAVSEIQFTIEGHDYQLFSGIPIMGGTQPANVWVRHDPKYLPSAHGGAVAADQQTGLGSGDLNQLYRGAPM